MSQAAKPPSGPEKKKSTPRQMVMTAGAIIGMVVGIGTMFGLGIGGAIPGALFGAGGAVLGSAVAFPISRLFPD